MDSPTSPVGFRRSSFKRLTLLIDRVFEDLETLESPSPKVMNKQMTQTFRQIGTMTEKLKKLDLNSNNFHANRHYQKTKNKINSYIESKYSQVPIKDSKRMVEILQNRPLTTFYKPSQKLLFNSLEQVGEVIKNNKRKFGEAWEVTPKLSLSAKLPEISTKTTRNLQEASPRSTKLSKLIKKLMVKNLGIKYKEEPEIKEHKTRYDDAKNKMNSAINNFVSNSDEIVFDDASYLGPEYIKYISDVDNSLKIQKYIGQNSGKRRKANQQFAKVSRLLM